MNFMCERIEKKGKIMKCDDLDHKEVNEVFFEKESYFQSGVFQQQQEQNKQPKKKAEIMTEYKKVAPKKQ